MPEKPSSEPEERGEEDEEAEAAKPSSEPEERGEEDEEAEAAKPAPRAKERLPRRSSMAKVQAAQARRGSGVAKLAVSLGGAGVIALVVVLVLRNQGNEPGTSSPTPGSSSPKVDDVAAHAQSLFQEGVKNEEARNYRAAVSALTKALELAPSNTEARFHRGCALLEVGNAKAAVNDLDAVLNVDPNHVAAHMKRAEAKLALDDGPGAVSDYDAAARLDPKSTAPLLGRAQLKQSLGDSKGAIADLGTVIERDPSCVAALEKRASLFIAARNDQGAIADLERLIPLKPDGPERKQVKLTVADLHAQRATASFADGRFKEALDEDEKALAIDADCTDAVFGRGMARAKLGKLKDALADYDHGLTLDPRRMDRYPERADLREKTGDFKGAIDDYSLYLNTHPDDFACDAGVTRCKKKLEEPHGGVTPAPAETDAKPKESDPTLFPFSPFADAKEGDWVVETRKNKGAIKMTAGGFTVSRVVKVENGSVTIRREHPGGQTEERTYAADWKPTVHEYLSPHATVTNVKIEDDKKTVAGREFACKKITWDSLIEPESTNGGGKVAIRAHNTAWFSKEVRVGRFVAETEDTHFVFRGIDLAQTVTLLLAGFGNGDKVEWGKKPEASADEDPGSDGGDGK